MRLSPRLVEPCGTRTETLRFLPGLLTPRPTHYAMGRATQNTSRGLVLGNKRGAARGRTGASHETTTLRFRRSYMARRASTCLFCVADGISDRSVGIIPIPGPSRPPRCGPPLVVGEGPSRPATWHAVVMPSVVEGLRPAILSGFLGISNLPGNFACFPRLSAEAGHALCRPRGITAVYPPPSPLHFSLD